MTLAVAIVTHRNASTIEACLNALLLSPVVQSIRVVDNDSDDDTLNIVARIAAREPRVRFIANETNPGFGVGINQAVADSPVSDNLLILNPDCVLPADHLERYLSHLQPGLLLGAVLSDTNGVADPASARNDIQFWPLLLSQVGRSDYSPYVKRDCAQTVQAVPAISGAAMLMSRSVFTQLHGFDESYRLHVEDLDLCRRARQIGATVAVCNDVDILHVRGVSSRKRPAFVEWNKHLGLLRYFAADERKRLNALQELLVYAMIWSRLPLALLRARLKAP